jgi:anti-sigma regulatory factor (Ser/Thr protein kinase)
MARARERGEDIRRFILDSVEAHPADIAKVTARRFRITRQAVSKHLQRLVADGYLNESGQTKSRAYTPIPLEAWQRSFQIAPGIAEDVVWTRDIRTVLGELPANVLNIWQHGFTEMFNNAIDHSDGSTIHVEIRRTAASTEMAIYDDGIGIFRKIQNALGLLDERHAIFELSKGKLTTDPQRHTGEGIFFTSRMFDSFRIVSGGVEFSHDDGEAEDWLLDNEHAGKGTAVFMSLHNRSSRTTKKIFDAYVSGEDYDFSKTIVPVRLALYGQDNLVSRSQAKRVLARVEQFRTVVFDFSEVPTIGQAFADEIFRVFANQHREIELVSTHANAAVKRMIGRAKAARN